MTILATISISDKLNDEESFFGGRGRGAVVNFFEKMFLNVFFQYFLFLKTFLIFFLERLEEKGGAKANFFNPLTVSVTFKIEIGFVFG